MGRCSGDTFFDFVGELEEFFDMVDDWQFAWGERLVEIDIVSGLFFTRLARRL